MITIGTLPLLEGLVWSDEFSYDITTNPSAETDTVNNFEGQSSGPLFRHAEFREMRPPAIEPPRRNYAPREDFITMFSPNPGATATGRRGSKGVVATSASLAKGRANAVRKSAKVKSVR